jgi:hypothetical protein
MPLQGALDASGPGDTVLVAPGTYPKAVTVDVAVLVQPDPGLAGPTPVLAGVTGSAATFRGLAFDGGLEPLRGVVVEAGTGLALEDCALADGVVGVEATGSCTVTGSLTNFLTGIVVFPGVPVEVTAEFTDCQTGLGAFGPLAAPPPGRTPAPECAVPAVRIIDCRFAGGQTGIDADGITHLEITGTRITGAGTGVSLNGSCAVLGNTEIEGAGGLTGVGLDLAASHAVVTGCRITGFATGVRVADGGTTVHAAGRIGGAPGEGNFLAGNDVDLSLEQPEWIDADYNHWGTLDCAALGIAGGLTPAWIADANLTLSISCAVPAEPVTWGTLKRRFGGDR